MLLRLALLTPRSYRSTCDNLPSAENVDDQDCDHFLEAFHRQLQQTGTNIKYEIIDRTAEADLASMDEFESRFCRTFNCILVVVTRTSRDHFKQFYARLLVFITTRSQLFKHVLFCKICLASGDDCNDWNSKSHSFCFHGKEEIDNCEKWKSLLHMLSVNAGYGNRNGSSYRLLCIFGLTVASLVALQHRNTILKKLKESFQMIVLAISNSAFGITTSINRDPIPIKMPNHIWTTLRPTLCVIPMATNSKNQLDIHQN